MAKIELGTSARDYLDQHVAPAAPTFREVPSRENAIRMAVQVCLAGIGRGAGPITPVACASDANSAWHHLGPLERRAR